ncbi:KipI antagonist, partial [Bacillus paralicheniformis]|nr:KipI antagonist [Bacillus paralicheniformis]
VVSADFSQVARVMQGEQVQLQLVSLQEAERIYIERETNISELSARLKLKYML